MCLDQPAYSPAWLQSETALETLRTYATSMTNHIRHEAYLMPYRRSAINCILEHDLELPQSESLSLIVESALAACQLFFAAALQHPSSGELLEVFEAFVLSCVSQRVGEVLL